jgi:hypothetical protein
MKRRDVIKTLALSPLLVNNSLRAFSSTRSFWQSPPPNQVFILLHGLFFLEYKGNNLVVTAPQVVDHDYQIGTPDNDGSDLQPIQGQTSLDFSDPKMGLVGDKAFTRRFPPELLQFSKKETGVGDLTGPFRFRCVLPCPLDIVPLRNGPRSDFRCVPGGIFLSMNKHPGEQISIVTCLVYTGSIAKIHPTSTNRCHFYAEPDFATGIEHTNQALAEAKLVFAHWDKFDLQLDTTKLSPEALHTVPARPPIKDSPRVPLSGDFEEDPLFAIRNPRPNSQGGTTQPGVGSSTTVAQTVNVANCGQYGVTSP